MGLFQGTPDPRNGDRTRPLADRMRPRTLDEFAGQEQLVAPGKPLRAQIERDDIGSLIFWGPPGTGKTTLAKIIASMTKAEFIEFSAVLAGISLALDKSPDSGPICPRGPIVLSAESPPRLNLAMERGHIWQVC